jgi:hypothetical protein
VGATVAVRAVKATNDGDLSPWLEALRRRRSGFDVESDFFTTTWFLPADLVIAPFNITNKDGTLKADQVTFWGSPIGSRVTGADGRFTLTGIGRERLATLSIAGPTIETAQINVMTRSGGTIRVPGYRRPGATADVTYVGARFDHVAGPTRPIEGTVRDKASGQPLAGILVRSEEGLGGRPFEYVQATTDAQGRYRLVGLPKGREGKLLASPAADQAYIRSLERVRGDKQAETLRLDFALTRGVRVVGRITDRVTGHPVKASVDYFVFVDNPHLEDSPGFRWAFRGADAVRTAEDGTFQITALPGSGVVVARAFVEHYIKGLGATNIPDPDHNGILDTHPYNVIPTNYHTIAAIDPPPGTQTLTCDLVVDPGRSLVGTVLGPDGAPLSGALLFGKYDMEYWEDEPLDTERFTLNSLQPGKPRFLQFLHEEKKLAGWRVVRGAEDTPPVVQLERWGVVTGRLVDADGQPRTGVQLVFSDGSKDAPLPHGSLRGNGAGMSGRIVPGGDGRFRIEGLAPGLAYTLEVEVKPGMREGWAIRNLVIKPGEIRDLGDIQAKRD